MAGPVKHGLIRVVIDVVMWSSVSNFDERGACLGLHLALHDGDARVGGPEIDADHVAARRHLPGRG